MLISDLACKIQKSDAKMIDSGKLRKKTKSRCDYIIVSFMIEIILYNANEPNHLTLRN